MAGADFSSLGLQKVRKYVDRRDGSPHSRFQHKALAGVAPGEGLVLFVAQSAFGCDDDGGWCITFCFVTVTLARCTDLFLLATKKRQPQSIGKG